MFEKIQDRLDTKNSIASLITVVGIGLVVWYLVPIASNIEMPSLLAISSVLIVAWSASLVIGFIGYVVGTLTSTDLPQSNVSGRAVSSILFGVLVAEKQTVVELESVVFVVFLVSTVVWIGSIVYHEVSGE